MSILSFINNLFGKEETKKKILPDLTKLPPMVNPKPYSAAPPVSSGDEISMTPLNVGNKTTTPSLIKPSGQAQAMKFPVADQTIKEITGKIAVGQEVKFPFLQKAAIIPQGVAESIIKSTVELPEKAVRSILQIPSILKNDTITSELTNKLYKVPTYQEEATDIFQAIIQGELPLAYAALPFVQVPLDMIYLSGLLQSGLKAIASGAKVPSDSHLSAWEFLGKPNTIEQAGKEVGRLQLKFHPDMPSGDPVIAKQINNAYNILKAEGIPKVSDIGAMAKRGLEILNSPITGYGKAPVYNPIPREQLPGYATVGEPQPAFGLSVQPVKEVGRGVVPAVKPTATIPKSPTATLAEEAKKAGSLEEFVEAQPKLYHGTTKSSAQSIEKSGFKIGGKTNLNKDFIGIDKELLGDIVWFTDTPQKAKVFAGQSGRLKFLEDAGVIEITEKNLKLAKPSDAIGGTLQSDNAKLFKIKIDDLKARGFDGLQRSRAETIVWNIDKVKTKAQLTEIYNQATKPKTILQSLAEEAKKYKSAEEFVKGKNVNVILDNNKIIDSIKTESQLPKVLDGFERFYRAESPTIKHRDAWGEKGGMLPTGFKKGDSFHLTPDIKYANYYKDTYGKDAKIFYFDLPEGLAKPSDKFAGEFTVTKSQLTDIYNQATKPKTILQSLAEEAKKYKSAEEFVEKFITPEESRKTNKILIREFEKNNVTTISFVEEYLENKGYGVGVSRSGYLGTGASKYIKVFDPASDKFLGAIRISDHRERSYKYHNADIVEINYVHGDNKIDFVRQLEQKFNKYFLKLTDSVTLDRIAILNKNLKKLAEMDESFNIRDGYGNLSITYKDRYDRDISTKSLKNFIIEKLNRRGIDVNQNNEALNKINNIFLNELKISSEYERLDQIIGQDNLSVETKSDLISIWGKAKSESILTRSSIQPQQKSEGRELPSTKVETTPAYQKQVQMSTEEAEKYHLPEVSGKKWEEYTAKVFKREDQRRLYQAVKDIGGISPYSNGFLAEEYSAIPKKFRRQNGVFMDEAIEMLKERGFNIDSESDLAELLQTHQKVTAPYPKKEPRMSPEKEAEIIRNRRYLVRRVRDYLGLTDADLRSINRRDIRLMSNYEFDRFINDFMAKASTLAQTKQAKNELLSQIEQKNLKRYDNLRRAMDLPPIDQMTAEQLGQFDEALSGYQSNDVFLGKRQLEMVDRTDLKGIKTLREARMRLAQEAGVPVERLDNIEVSGIDKYKWDNFLAEKNSFYKLMVDNTTKQILIGDANYLKFENELDELVKKARKSRPRKFLQKLAPTDDAVWHYLEAGAKAESEEARVYADKAGIRTDSLTKADLRELLTPEELDLANYLTERYAEAREYLIKIAAMKTGRENYITHIRRGWLEALKDDGLKSALGELFSKYKEDEQIFNILDEQTGEILPLEKFFQFTQRRTGQLRPSKNVAKIASSYFRLLERKKALDALIPKIDIYVASLTPHRMTPRGLEFDTKLKRFVKQWLNTKKGRVAEPIWEQGGKIDLSLKAINGFMTLIDLGLNLPVGLASNIGEQVTTYVTLGKKQYVLGVARNLTPRGKRIVNKYRNFTGKSLWSEVWEASKDINDSLTQGMFGLFHNSNVAANRIMLLGSLTKEELASETVSPERLAQMKLDAGRWRNMEGAKSIYGATTAGQIVTKYKTWALPIFKTTVKDLGALTKVIRGKQKINSREMKELWRIMEISVFVLSLYAVSAPNENDDSFVGQLKKKVYSELGTITSALSPKTLFSVPRLLTFVSDLSTAMTEIITLEKYKMKEGYKGVEHLKDKLTPRMIKQFVPEEKKGRPALPKLPKLPKFTKLPKLKSGFAF